MVDCALEPKQRRKLTGFGLELDWGSTAPLQARHHQQTKVPHEGYIPGLLGIRSG